MRRCVFCRPCESRDPYAVSRVLEDAVRRLSRNNESLWIWVPAFAGTTLSRCLTIESENLGERNRKAVIDGLPLPVPHQRPAHQCAVGPLAPAHRRVEPQPGETFDVGGAGTPR